MLLLVVFVLAVIAQAAMYSVFTLGCGPKAIGEHYAYPGGAESNFGDGAYNLVPGATLLSEREHNFWGWPMDVLPANVAATAAGAQVGTWWRNAGIFFYTYTYEDIANSKLTMYMRQDFLKPWLSYRIARCDGKGPIITFSESGHWVNNKVRSIFRMNQAQSFSIWFDSEKVADAQEVNNGYPSLTITNITNGKEVAASILNNRNFHGNRDQWYVHNLEHNSMPYFVAQAVSLPFAYTEVDVKTKIAKAKADADAKEGQPPPKAPAYFLDATVLADAKQDETKTELTVAPVVKAEAAVVETAPEQHV